MRVNLQNPANSSLHGGPAVFTERLKGELISRGYYAESDYDTWLNLSFRPVPLEVQARNPRIVIRFDGTWNMAAWPWWGRTAGLRAPLNTLVYRWLNRHLLRNIELADAFVFQSIFSRNMVSRLYGKPLDKPSRIIFNGVDLTHFFPDKIQSKASGPLKILVSHKHWAIKRSWLIPDIVAELTAGRDFDVQVRVLGGDTPNPLPGMSTPLGMFRKNALRLGISHLFEFPGHISPDHLPEQYRWADIMLNLSFADPCPNVVVEALASGLPVIGPATGGLAELVNEPGWLVDSGEDPFGLYNPYVYSSLPGVDVESYVRLIEQIAGDLDTHRQSARRRAEDVLDIVDVVDAYVEVLQMETT